MADRPDGLRKLLDEQIEYYRVRAPEYDDWCNRVHSYDLGSEANEIWNRETRVVEDAFRAFAPTGRVLELACGTGWWTERLAGFASSLTCVDASQETIAIAREKVPDATYVQADLFAWEPDETYDVVFFSFWISHVPHELFESFWSMVSRALAPGGRAFFIDNLRRENAKIAGLNAFLNVDDRPDGVVTRQLEDGTEYRAVKLYYEPSELEDRLCSLGWDASVEGTETFFYYGSAVHVG